VKEFKVYRRVIESMIRLDLAENPIGTPQPRQPQQPRQPLQEYEVPVQGKSGIYYRRQRVKQYRPNYRPVGSSAQTPTAPQPQAQPQTPTAPQPQAQPQMPTAPRRSTEAELANPQQPSQEFLSRVAKRTSTPEETQQTTMEMIVRGELPSDGQQTSGQDAQTAPANATIDLDALHDDYMKGEEQTTKIDEHPEGYISYHMGRQEDTTWILAPSYPKALKEIEQHLGHPMLLGGFLTVTGGFPAYLETRAGYGKTTMARALDQRIDSLYARLEENPKDRDAARELAQLPFADVVLIEPKTDVAELVGYLYVASNVDPSTGRIQNPYIVNELADFLLQENLVQTEEEAKQKAERIANKAIDVMTGGGVSGKTAIAPTSEVQTALERATRWRMPNGRMAKPVLFVYDDAHKPEFFHLIQTRLTTALAANTMYGMPYLTVAHLLFANPNDRIASDEFASRLMPWITPADVTIKYGLRGKTEVSERLRARARHIARIAAEKVLGESINKIDKSKIRERADEIQKAFEEEVEKNLSRYGLSRREKDKVLKTRADEYLAGDLGTPHYMDAIATAVSQAGLDAVTAGWHWRPEEEVVEDNIYSQYAGTPGFTAAYTPEELKKLAERHAAFARAVQWNDSEALKLLVDDEHAPPDWKKVHDFINAHMRSPGQKINWYNERRLMNREEDIDAGPDRTPRDWQRLTGLTALFGAMGRPDMVAYTIGMIGGINPEVTMPQITVNHTPAQVESMLERYFTAQNLSPSVQAMLRGQQLTPEEYAAGLKEYARAVIFTTQADGSAGEHTIYSILKPHVATILKHGNQQTGSGRVPLAHKITVGSVTPSDHKTSDIYKNPQTDESVKWYETHRADFKKLLNNLYIPRMRNQANDAEIQRNAEAAHTALSILASLMHSMHATAATGGQQRNAILKSAKHARENLISEAHQPLRTYVASAARMAAALRRFSEVGTYEKLKDDDKQQLHKFGHLVAFAHQRKDENGNPSVDDDIKDLVATIHRIATSSSNVRTGQSAEGTGNFAPLSEKKWNADFADALAKVLTS
jgi:hypothetical protein